MTTLDETEFYGKDLVSALVVAGFKAVIEQTGGGTATFAVQNSPEDERILIGPGSFDWKNPGNSIFTTDELFIGEDNYGPDGEDKNYDPDFVSAESGATMEEIALIVKAEYEKVNG